MVAPSSVTLSDYLSRLRRLLHDPSDQGWSLADKIAYINEAIQRRDLDTGGIRRKASVTLTINQYIYTYTELSTGFASATANIFDIISITLLYTGYRILLNQLSYSEMVSVPGYIAYTALSNRPAGWAPYGDQSIVIGPPPSQAYTIEVDALTYSPPTLMSALTDPDTLQFPYTQPVPFYAAYLAKTNERELDQAEWFRSLYVEAIETINTAKTGAVPSMYPRGVTRAG